MMNNKEKVKLSRSCFDGYLTEGCPHCVFWNDGDNEILKLVYSKLPAYKGNEPGIGCNCCFPIGQCPFFMAMERGISLNEES